MHIRYTTSSLTLFILLALSLAWSPVASAQQREPMRRVCTTTQLTDNSTSDNDPQIDNGQIVWWHRDSQDREIFFWDGVNTTQITNNSRHDEAPLIDNGQIAWMYRDIYEWEIFFWDGETTTNITDNEINDFGLSMNNGQIVWQANDGADDEIFLWDGETTTQITDNSEHDYEPQINNGQIVWQGWDGNDWEIFFWDGETITNISNNNIYDEDPQISNGQVVWDSHDGEDWEVFFWDGLTTIQLTDNNKYIDDRFSRINNGQVVWETSNGSEAEIFFFDGETTTQITDNLLNDVNPSVDNGQVVWQHWDGNDWELFLWDGLSTIQITNNITYDRNPQIENGQVVWHGDDGNDYEIYLADCNQFDETPLSLVVSGDLDTPIVLPILRWVHQTELDQTNTPAFQFRVYLAKGTTKVLDYTADAASLCTGLECELSLDGLIPRWGLTNGDYSWWVAAIINGQAYWSARSDFSVNVPAPLIPGGLTNDPRQGQPIIIWNDDPNTLFVQLWIGGADNGKIHNVWYERNGSDNAFVCADGFCTIEPGIIWPEGTYKVWMRAWGPGGTSIWKRGYDLILPPNHPTELDPNGQLFDVQPVKPTFSWQGIVAGETYRIYVRQADKMSVVVNMEVDASEACTAVDCSLSAYELANWGLKDGTYEWWAGTVLPGEIAWSTKATFTVDVPAPALPDPVTVDPADGRIAITFPDDPNTFWVQVWAGPHPKGNYNQWHERDGAGKSFTCDGVNCVLYPAWDVAAKDGSGTPYSLKVWLKAWGPGGVSSGGTTYDEWNNSAPFNLPTSAATLPSNIIVGGTPSEPGFSWTGGANATWYQIIIRPTGTETVVYKKWFQAWDANCPGALVETPDYDCSAANLGLSAKLTAGTDYDVFIKAWGPGGTSSGGSVTGMEQYAISASPTFTYNP